MKLMKICFIFFIFISPIFGELYFDLDFKYGQQTFKLNINKSIITALFTTVEINANYSIAITPKDNCPKPEEKDFCYQNEPLNPENINETINVNFEQFTGPLYKSSITLGNLNLFNMSYVYAGNSFGGIVSFDKEFITYLYKIKYIDNRNINFCYMKYLYFNQTIEQFTIKIGENYDIKYKNSLILNSTSKKIEVNEIDFAFSINDFRNNLISVKEYKLNKKFSIEFYHYLDSDSIYGPENQINELVNILKENNFTCNEVNNTFICDSLFYYGYFKIQNYGLQFKL